MIAVFDSGGDTGGIQGSGGSGSTVITLASFTASTLQNGVILKWEKTASETGNAGFNIWRSEEVAGEYIKINDSLIPAEVSDYQYSFTDDAAVTGKTYYYKLEDIDLNGTSTFHGPVLAGRPNTSFLPAILLLLRD